MRISFHGGAGTVTGSRHLLEAAGTRILIDAGLFQGLKKLRLLNWKRPEFDPAGIDHLILTHTHIDHSGYIPRLVREGFRGPIHCTRATFDLAKILLLDSAHIQEQDAKYANRKGFSKHRPALPLYTQTDVRKAFEQFRPVPYQEWIDTGRGIRARFLQAGHILGSAMVELEAEGRNGNSTRFLFSGDVGRYDMPLHPDPATPPSSDILIVESTYGDREHDPQPVEEQIRVPFEKVIERRGVILIPAFAVGRSQQVTLILRDLINAGKLPDVPIHIDSPMAINATEIYSRYIDEHNLDSCIAADGRSRLFPRNVFFHRSVEESKQLNRLKGPRVILSASGMMTAGRILHHLSQRLPHRENLLCLVGYQAAGTRGRTILQGGKQVRIHGRNVPVRAERLIVHGLSGHADRNELIRWIGSAPRPPATVFVTHGDPEAASSLGKAIEKKFGSRVFIPALGDHFDLDSILKKGRNRS
ncbi:MAG: MBL fold metallo-hydrolase [Acidobacteria bacterium]|nr:MBL fold metallo-hydrolase [Acidobacteriota bacterium]